jgi:hypothetical protein
LDFPTEEGKSFRIMIAINKPLTGNRMTDRHRQRERKSYKLVTIKSALKIVKDEERTCKEK